MRMGWVRSQEPDAEGGERAQRRDPWLQRRGGGAALAAAAQDALLVTKATSGANLRAKNLLSQVSEAKATSGASIRIYAKNEFTGK